MSDEPEAAKPDGADALPADAPPPERHCRSCGSALAPGATFCTACGTDLTTGRKMGGLKVRKPLKTKLFRVLIPILVVCAIVVLSGRLRPPGPAELRALPATQGEQPPELKAKSGRIPRVPDGTIIVDGRTDDWEVIDPLVSSVGSKDRKELDPLLGINVDPRMRVDVRSVKAARDEADLFLLIEADPSKKSFTSGFVTVLVDSDGDAATGIRSVLRNPQAPGAEARPPCGWDHVLRFDYGIFHGADRVVPSIVYRIEKATEKDVFEEFVATGLEHMRVLRAVADWDEEAFDQMERKRRAGGRNNLEDPSYLSLDRSYRFQEVRIPLDELGIAPPVTIGLLFIEGPADILTYEDMDVGVLIDYDKYCEFIRAEVEGTEDPRLRAAEALGQIGDRSAIPALRGVLDD